MMMENQNDIIQKHLNRPQVLSALIDAPHEYQILGRGTGKTEFILAPKIAKRVFEMPRSTRVLVGATFQQLLTRTLPPLVKGWEDFGYKRDVHFVFGRPKKEWIDKWGWKGPHRLPFDWKYVVSWCNGTIIQLISQDRIGSTNGMSVDGVDGDEAKLLNLERLRSEVFAANRGPNPDYEGNPHHHGVTLITDMPTGQNSRWLLDKKNDVNQEKINDVLQLSLVANKYLLYARTEEHASVRRDYMLKYESTMNLINKIKFSEKGGFLYYSEASTLENVHALGVGYIRQLMRDLTKFEFSTSILGLRPRDPETAFYKDLDENVHGYYSYNYKHFDKFGYDFSSLTKTNKIETQDDYDPNSPFFISMDYNKRIVTMPAAQLFNNKAKEKKELRIVNEFFTKDQKLQNTLDLFLSFYKNHKEKMIYYFYDHTMVAEYAHTVETQAQQTVKHLRKNGWKVKEIYIGQGASHKVRYETWEHVLTESGLYDLIFRYNREMARYCFESMTQANIKFSTRKGVLQKDKSSELLITFPQEEATHFSEALDTLLWGVLNFKSEYHQNHSEVLGYEFY